MANRRNNNNYKTKQSKHGKSQSRPKTKRSDRNTGLDSEDMENSTNDVSWYSTDPNLLRDAASIPFSWSVGTPIDNVYDESYNIPGVQVMYLAPSIGWSTLASDPVNLASTSFYSYIRHANSGHANYDDLDLTLMLVCSSQIYAFINWAQRLYGLSFLYAQRNRYLPKALIEAEWVDPDNLAANLANFRYGINVLINKMSSIWVPAVMTIFSRQAFLYQNIYCEGPSIKDQLYYYSPHGFWKYDFDGDGAGCAKYTMLRKPGVKLTVDSILAYGNMLIDALLDEEDIGIMCGDIYKAYGDGGIIKLAALPENYLVAPIYDPAVLSQMKNATTLSLDPVQPMQDVAVNNFSIFQDKTKGWLTHTPTIPNTFNEDDEYFHYVRLMRRSRLLTLDSEEVTPDMIMEASRLMFSIDKQDNVGESGFGAIHAGSEIVMCCGHIQARTDGSYLTYWCNTVTPVGSVTPQLISKYYAIWSNFKYHPFARISLYSEAEQSDFSPSFDVDNYAVLDYQEIDKLNEAALLNEFGIHGIAKVVR
nr:putative capsid [Marmot picobirnavirus]